MKNFFDHKKNLYYVLVVSIVTLLLGSQVLVHVQLGQMNTDGELINNAGRMRMLSQRIVQQSLRIHAGEMLQEDLNTTVSAFKNHINFIREGISKSLFLEYESDFRKAFSLANEIVIAGEFVLAHQQDAAPAITTLTKVESNFIEAQNRAVEIIQSKYESKLILIYARACFGHCNALCNSG
jgi:nitrate/nitrite-specific signal transduction histidine kinase